MVQDVADIDHAREHRRLGVILHSQTSTQFGLDLDLVTELHAAGLRVSGLAYNLRTPAADGCVESTNAGLSRFGHRLVQELNEVGIVVDGSHAGERSTLDAIDRSSRPIVFSHSGCRALHEHPRNITDEQIRRCADRGGVIGIVGVPMFLNGTPSMPLSVLGDHLIHALEVAGPDHVGLGLDYWFGFAAYADQAWPCVDPWADGGRRHWQDVGDLLWDPEHLPPADAPDDIGELPTAAELPTLTRHLLDRGLTEHEVAGLLGANWLRVLRACWTLP
jgi:membrane dipeptidase